MYEKLNDLLILLCRTISTRMLYFDGHPKVQSLIDGFIRQLHELCLENKLDKLFIGIIDGSLVFEGRSLVGPSIVGRQLIVFAEKLHSGGLSFSQQTSKEEFRNLLNLTIDLTHAVDDIKTARELLISKNIHNIELAHQYTGSTGPTTRDQQSVWKGQDSGNFLHSPTLVYQALFDSVAQAHGDVVSGNDIDTDNTRSVSEYMLHFTRTHFSDLMQHVHYPDYDSYTVGHSVRVAALAVFFANSLSWSDEIILSIGTAGLLHDIGKSSIPDEILYKPGRLSEEEFALMMTHSQVGAEILLAQKRTTPLDIAAAWGHHIRHDGSGYPLQPKWATTHPLTALLHICDTFEALTAARPYKPTLSPHMAFSLMLGDKGGYDPGLLASFIATVGIYPPGNIVRISNGTKGTVLSAGKRIDRPKVTITHNSMGVNIPEEDQQVLDLSTEDKSTLFIEEFVFSDPVG